MEKYKFTHEGILYGCDSRTPDNYRRKVKLRETKCYYVTEHGDKYRKRLSFGFHRLAGVIAYPMYMLGGVQEVEHE